MSFKVQNKTNKDLSVLENLVNKFYPYAQKRMNFSEPLQLSLVSDDRNSSDPLGKTAHYSPGEREIVIYVDGRHPKDILRSFSHELVHHTQNCRGEFNDELETNEGYAQNNKHLREMESEAYLEGNLCFRDWENSDDPLGDTKMESALENKIREVVRSFLLEKTKKDAPDRRPPDTPHDRLKPLEEDEVAEEGVVEEDSAVKEEEVVEEEETLDEWKNKSINKLLMEKWCK